MMGLGVVEGRKGVGGSRGGSGGIYVDGWLSVVGNVFEVVGRGILRHYYAIVGLLSS